jgi:hypothetical protein
LEPKDTKKAAKKIIRTYKKHPDWYTPEEIRYVKLIKKVVKENERQSQNSPE